MLTIEEIRAMTPEERTAYEARLGRKLLIRVLAPKLLVAATLIVGSRYVRNRSYQASTTEH